MPIDVISFLQPANDNPFFGVASDFDMTGGWRAVADVAARDAIYTGRRLEGMRVYTIATGQLWRLLADLTTWELLPPGGFADDELIYVDPAGDDSAPGTVGDPLATIYEATKRIPLHGTTQILLNAGQHDLTDHGLSSLDGPRTVIGGPATYVAGVRSTLDSFTFASMSNNVMTAQGSPGWTIDEHIGKSVSYDPFGPPFESFALALRVLSNTADTLTLAATSADQGGPLTLPSVGATVDIVEMGSKVVGVAGGNTASRLHYVDNVTFRDVFFDGTTNSDLWGPSALYPAKGSFVHCEFEGYSFSAIEALGSLVIFGCAFQDCSGNAISSGASTAAQGDNYFENCTTAIKCSGAGQTGVNAGNYYLWAKDCQKVFEIQNTAMARDDSIGVWLDNCDYYVRIDGHGTYQKESAALGGFDATKRTLNTRVIWFNGDFCSADLFDSSTSTVEPDAAYLRFKSTNVSRTDHVANGSATFDGFGNGVTG